MIDQPSLFDVPPPPRPPNRRESLIRQLRDNGGFNPEEQAKEHILAVLQDLRQQYIEEIRHEMIDRSVRRLGTRFEDRSIVTPDEAREYFEKHMDPPPASELSRNFLAGVFRGRGWETVGMMKSRTKGSHANRLFAYRWRGRS